MDDKEYAKTITQVIAYNLQTLPMPKDEKMPTKITLRLKYPDGEVGYDINFSDDLKVVEKVMDAKLKRKENNYDGKRA